jgi:hypothetical protein
MPPRTLSFAEIPAIRELGPFRKVIGSCRGSLSPALIIALEMPRDDETARIVVRIAATRHDLHECTREGTSDEETEQPT